MNHRQTGFAHVVDDAPGGWIEPRDSVTSAEPDGTVVVTLDGHDSVVEQSPGDVPAFDRSHASGRVFLHAVHSPAIGRHPQRAAAITMQRGDMVVGQVAFAWRTPIESLAGPGLDDAQIEPVGA